MTSITYTIGRQNAISYNSTTFILGAVTIYLYVNFLSFSGEAGIEPERVFTREIA